MPPKPQDVLDQARSLLQDRIGELDDERKRLEGVLSDLTGGRVGRRRPGRPRGSRTTKRRRTTGRGRAASTRSTGTKRGRRRTTRSDQALRQVKGNPGISAGEIAKKMRIQPNYVYRVMSDLQKEGKVRKKGRGYTAA